MHDADLPARVLLEIPEEYQERFLALCARPARQKAELLAALEAYVVLVEQVGQWGASVDPASASRIAATCEVILQRATLEQMEVVSAVVAYFVEEEEDEEVTGVLGFDDDIQVVNALCRLLDWPDLLVART